MLADLAHDIVETNGIHLHVVTAGDPHGKPVILLHGFPEFWFGWHHQMPSLVEAGFHVIIPDQRGYNLSDKPGGIEPYCMQELVNDIMGLAEHFGLQKINLVGHDWGAAVAWSLAIRHPEKMEHLAVLNVPHPFVMSDFILHSPRQLLKSWYIIFFQLPWLPEHLMAWNNCASAARLLKGSSRAGTFTAEEIYEYKRAWEQPGALNTMINWYRAAFRHRSSLALNERVVCPTLILWGKRDVALRAEMAQRSLELCNLGRLVYFEESSHWVQHEQVDSINRFLVDFLLDK
jgi:epoxide hydrolase 4